MAYRNGNYSSFYVAEPFNETNLGAYLVRDFRYYNLLKSWKGADASFPFIDSHDKTYNVRDNSDWECTLKPRLHLRLRNSKNVILFLSGYTANSMALREEIDYAINSQGLPIIVIYPDYSEKSDIVDINGDFKEHIVALWNKIPVLRDNMYKVATIHIPLKKELVKKCLEDSDLAINTQKVGRYYFPIK